MEPYVFHSDSNHVSGIRVTVVGEIVDGTLKLAASRCSSKDSFVKKVGREKALERLTAGNVFATVPIDKPLLSTFIGAASAVSEAVINHGIYQKVTLIENSKIYRNGFFGFENGSKNTFSYILD